MLNLLLQRAWDDATEAEREVATAAARVLLANLIHYRGAKSSNHVNEDVQLAAAEMLRFRKAKL